jgi:putative SOS response-associated peptidase YedK
MCGRFSLHAAAEEITEAFGVAIGDDALPLLPRYNVAPTDPMPIVRHDKHGQRKLEICKWGLIPFWAKTHKIAARHINARSEKADTTGAFRYPFRERRCLVPTDGFYEWIREGKQKLPVHFRMRDERIFAFAGLYQRWTAPDGEVWNTFTILTCTPNTLVAPVHDRMPVIMPRDSWDAWLDRELHDVETIRALCGPFDPSLMEGVHVSTRVNSVRNDDPECLVPLPADDQTLPLGFPPSS